MDYHVGQLVACIDDEFRFTAELPSVVVIPKKGSVYRVRTLDLFRARGMVLPFLRLHEIINPSYSSIIGDYEPVFEASAFLPLDPKRLDVFRTARAPVDRVPA